MFGFAAGLNMETRTTEQARWFAAEVQPHEPALRAYVRSRFPTVDADDLVQESYFRLLRARASRPITCAKAYLFTTITNAALALFRRPAIFSSHQVTDSAVTRILQPDVDAAEVLSRKQEIELLLAAIEALPARCREIMILRKLQGMPQKAVAAQLGLSEQTVQVQVARGARKCAEYLQRHGVATKRGGDK